MANGIVDQMVTSLTMEIVTESWRQQSKWQGSIACTSFYKTESYPVNMFRGFSRHE